MAVTNTKENAGTDGITSETGGLETVMLRNDFYRENYRRLTVTCLALVLIVAGSIGFSAFLYATRPAPQYFATTAEGALIKLSPLDQPNMSDPSVLTWATEAIIGAYSFNFVNYREVFNDIRINFTNVGYQNYIKAINASNNLKAVIDKKLVVSAVPTGAPIITAKGLAGSVYAWRIEIPVLITYESASENLKQSIIVKLLIKRLNTLENPKGVGIEQFVIYDAR